jgi:hypothetical protein
MKTVDDAINEARRLLKREGLSNVNTSLVKNRDPDEKIKDKEFKQIANELYLDTLYWEGRFP